MLYQRAARSVRLYLKNNFRETEGAQDDHSDERPEDESYNVLPFPCTCSVTSLVVLLPSPAKHLVMIEMGGR